MARILKSDTATAIATFHDQPPIETRARRWRETFECHDETTVGDILRWANADRRGALESVELVQNSFHVKELEDE